MIHDPERGIVLFTVIASSRLVGMGDAASPSSGVFLLTDAELDEVTRVAWGASTIDLPADLTLTQSLRSAQQCTCSTSTSRRPTTSAGSCAGASSRS